MSTEELLVLLERLEIELGAAMSILRTYLRHSDDFKADVNTTNIARIKSFITDLTIPDTSTWTG